MSETPQHDREAIWRRARERAVRMGLAQTEPAQQPEAPAMLSEHLKRHPEVMRKMLGMGRLGREEAAAAREFLTEYDAEQARLRSAPTPELPGDAA